MTVLDEDLFYFTNFYHYRDYTRVEDNLMLYWGSVGFYDGHRGYIVQERLNKPNGIALSPCKR